MTDHSYLDIHPSQCIADKLEIEVLNLEKLQELLDETTAYISTMEQENMAYLESRIDPTISSRDTLRFLRSQERTGNTKLLLQYLSTFCNDLPLEDDLLDNPANPFEQIKTFSLYNADLLREKDVVAAILQEHQRLGLLNETNSWYYCGKIEKSHKSITDIINHARRATIPDYQKIFQGLIQLCNFWFSVRNQQAKRVRKSDLLIFKLSRILLAKY